jgi:hypothetical protein
MIAIRDIRNDIGNGKSKVIIITAPRDISIQASPEFPVEF